MYWVRRSGLPLPPTAPRYPINADPNPFVWVDLNKCILCTRCVRACEEVQGRFVWGWPAAAATGVVAGAGTTMLDARCESCGPASPTARPAPWTTSCRSGWASPTGSSRPPAPTAGWAAGST